MRSHWAILEASRCPEQFGAVFRAGKDALIGILPIHPFSVRPSTAALEKLRGETGIVPRIYTGFDLQRRPFWVANDLLRIRQTLMNSMKQLVLPETIGLGPEAVQWGSPLQWSSEVG